MKVFLGTKVASVNQDTLRASVTVPAELSADEKSSRRGILFIFFATSLQIFVFKTFSLELMTSNMQKESLAENAIIASYI